jgi:glucose/arabinose dehydrogenase
MPERRWAGRVSLALSLLLLAPLIAFISPATAATPPAQLATVPLDQVNTTTTQVAFGLRRPVAIAAPRDGTNRLFIVEKRGTVRVYHPDTGLAADPIIDIMASVDESGNERGLLGIAFASDFAQTQHVYLAYTALPDGAVTVARYRLNERVLEPLLAQPHAEFDNHNGGQITFGPDGNLYLSIGDGGGAADPLDSAQRLNTLLGKIVRIDVRRTCGTLAYCVPADNPFVGVAGARPEIWMYGGRNPWKFSFDIDGSMWIADVGQGRWEEINHVRAGRQAGANLGWSCFEGLEVFDQAQCKAGATYTKPIFTYSPWTGGCAVIGGEVYRGQDYGSLMGGTYVATDYCSNTVWAIRPDGQGGYIEAEIGEMPTQVTAFASTQRGEFYVVNDLPGGLHRVGFERIPPLCSVKATTQKWGTGMNVNITITNTGTTPINAWTLTFMLPLGQTLNADWNTNLTQGGPLVNASNAEHNGTIAPGRSVTFGYQVSHTGETSTATRYTLNERSCAVVR